MNHLQALLFNTSNSFIFCSSFSYLDLIIYHSLRIVKRFFSFFY
uniref:Uncharacterized protein n=1 Tax=Siphoviridae sp. ctX926 TaxID=2826366 RepID=A0A8S5M104_9CAUD|nr:MAG TPA: hypothetical protein [Siphoviridae sp. ctX926]